MKSLKLCILAVFIFIGVYGLVIFYGLKNQADTKINIENFKIKLVDSFGKKTYKAKTGKNSPIYDIEKSNWKEASLNAKYSDTFVEKFTQKDEPILIYDVLIEATPNNYYAWNDTNNPYDTLTFSISIKIDERKVMFKEEVLESFKQDTNNVVFDLQDNKFDDFILLKNNSDEKISYKYHVNKNSTKREESLVTIEAAIKDKQRYVWDDGLYDNYVFDLLIKFDNRKEIAVDDIEKELQKFDQKQFESVEEAIKFFSDITLFDNKAFVTKVEYNIKQDKEIFLMNLSIILDKNHKWNINPDELIKIFNIEVIVKSFTVSFESLDKEINEITNQKLSADQTIFEIEQTLYQKEYLVHSSITVLINEENTIQIGFTLSEEYKWKNGQNNKVELEKNYQFY
ncbi:hypothetical protein CXP39_03220 [Mesoplasma syrphidae]|uniref:Uncharacterized protein n=1 Tax=Mesoplasma syrphidae TaxID=225999 RepID=A0A2K9BKN0_9MOLU|nr:hypothetical protein [Mesoplasma syrphidae]AUF83786.1 hypothetical protein CXP39_03220 [Mesoplasma syrphidae]